VEIGIERDNYEVVVDGMGENHVIINGGKPNFTDMNRVFAIAAHD
jgi:hypothetical protein